MKLKKLLFDFDLERMLWRCSDLCIQVLLGIFIFSLGISFGVPMGKFQYVPSWPQLSGMMIGMASLFLMVDFIFLIARQEDEPAEIDLQISEDINNAKPTTTGQDAREA